MERPLPEVIDNNLIGLHAVYEGARRHGVRRVVFASSNHAFGMYSVDDKLSLDSAFRPDGLYGLSKVWGEAMARMYWDKHGIEGISLRIGSTLEKPTAYRHLSTWLGHDDLVHLMMQSITAPDVEYLAVWGVSNNTRSYWSNEGAERLGFSGGVRRGLRRGDPQPCQSPRPSGAAAPGRQLRLTNYTPPDQRPKPLKEDQQ